MEVTNINFDTFVSVHLVIGEILSCEPVEGSSKLLKLSVDLGEYGTRQILAGVAKSFSPDDLVGKQGIYVANLAPRQIMGMDSEGMMLFARDSEGKLEMTTISNSVKNGTRVS